LKNCKKVYEIASEHVLKMLMGLLLV